MNIVYLGNVLGFELGARQSGLGSRYDSVSLLSLPERSHAEGLGGVPTDSDISLAISKLHGLAPEASGLRASAWKALADEHTTFDC